LCGVTVDRAATAVQFAYPQVFYACHTRHTRRRSSAVDVSDRDVQILVHLDGPRPMSLTSLAAHMDLAASTLSEAVTRLVSLGLVLKRGGHGGDGRRVGLVLTPRGTGVVTASSVLETDRLRLVLRRLTPAERRTVVTGLTLLARASVPVARAKRLEP
jgi:DNA-binding MarR family transcriptional regulator